MVLSTVTDEVLPDRSSGALPRIFEAATREGVTNFEIRMVEAKRYPVCEAQAWNRLKEFASEYGITFSAVSPGLFKPSLHHDLTPLHSQYLLPMSLDLAETIGVKTLVVFGVERDVQDRAGDFSQEDLIPICRDHGITLQAYSPLEQGLLSGCLPRDYRPTGAQCSKKWFQPLNMQRAMDMMDAWRPLCEKYHCTIPNLALAWVLAQGENITVLSGAVTVDEIQQNVRSAGLVLSGEDVQAMRQMAEVLDQ